MAKETMYFVVLIVSLLICIQGSVDRTREDRAVGSDITLAVVDIVRENCIFPDDRVFLRRLAYVQSMDGLNTNAFRPGFYGGIWQVKEADFNATKTCHGVENQCQLIQSALNIHWQDVLWENLTVPLYSGIAASLYVQQETGGKIPGEINKQAEFWVNTFQQGRTTSFFLSEIQKIPSNLCQIDLVFILDTSGSIGYINFIDILGFIKKITRQLVIGPRDVQVAIVSYSDYARIEFGLAQYQSQDELEHAINFVNYDAAGTATADGIKLARESVFKRNSRPGATKVGLVITDGSSDNFQDTVREAREAKEDGIVMFAIGIGKINKVELDAISSPPNCTHVILLSGFSEIDNVVYEIKNAACRAPIVVDSSGMVGINGSAVDIHGVSLNVTYQHSINTTTTLAFVTQRNDSNITGSHNALEVKVNCGVVKIYLSYDNPHPSAVFYSEKLTATDGHPALLYLNKTADGRPLYMTYVGKPLPMPERKKCNDSNYFTTFAHINKTNVDIVCKENGKERNCTPSDFQLKPSLKDLVCPPSYGSSVPNPCSVFALQKNELYHIHPFDNTKFIKCDYQQKMYIVQCPDGERYRKGSDSCGLLSPSTTEEKVPLDHDIKNPCTPQSLMNNSFFFVYFKDKTKFIHCDVWGHAWVLNCSSNMVWDQAAQTCLEDKHNSTNPCARDLYVQGITMFPHPDKHKYIHCDNALNPYVQACTPNTVFNFKSQTCVWETAPVG